MEYNKELLLKNQAYVNGEWISAFGNKVFEVQNPFDNSVITTVPDMGKEETSNAIEAAAQAFLKWKAKSASGRAKLLRKWYDLQKKYANDLAYLLTLEQGKPLAEARGEIHYGASFVEWFAEEAKRIYGDVIPGHGRDKRIVTIKQAIGVVGAITPWNFPSAMITRKVAPALAAGCTVVIKPSEETPLSALALAELAHQAGFPPGVINIITSNRPIEVGQELTANTKVRKISFTGSTKVGKLLLKQSADTVKKVSMELGGNAPFIVFDDADLEAAIDGAIETKYRNTGQTCICANRIFVQSKIYNQFIEGFQEKVKSLKLGSGLEQNVSIGPLINKSALEKVDRLVGEAKNHGAKVLTGGNQPIDFKGNFYEPTILKDVNAEMSIHKEEIFGPVAPVYTFDTEQEVIELANKTEYGLAAYFYGRDYARIWRVAEGLEFGMIGINTGMISTAMAPFGGVKESGMGREGSKYGIDDYLEIKYLCWGNVK